MTLRGRVLLAFAAVAVLLGLPLGYAVNRLRAVRGIAVTLSDRYGDAYANLGALRAAVAEFDREVRSYVIVPDAEFRSQMRATLAKSQERARRLEQVGFGAEVAPSRRWLDSLSVETARLETFVESGRAEEATALVRARMTPALTAMEASLADVEQAVNDSGAAAAATARDISATSTRMATGGAFLALLLALGVVAGTTWAITGPLRKLQQGMASVAAGGVTARPDLPYARRDEIGDLSRSFRVMTEQLAELERMRGEFLNVVSHDLKAPLSLIDSYAELIEEDSSVRVDPEAHRLLLAIREHVHQLIARVNRLLSLGRLEARAYAIAPEAVPVRPFFHGIRRAFEPLARRHDIGLTLTVEDTAPATMVVDVESLQHEIIENLLSNALKFTPRNGKVALRVWGDDGPSGGVHFSVTDSGPGIPEEDLPHVFSKYYQTGRRASSGGVGLGLTIAYELVRVHGGTIEAANAPAGGTEFHVALPFPPHAPDDAEASRGRLVKARGWRRAVTRPPPAPVG